jgi:hypothetical protein
LALGRSILTFYAPDESITTTYKRGLGTFVDPELIWILKCMMLALNIDQWQFDPETQRTITALDITRIYMNNQYDMY